MGHPLLSWDIIIEGMSRRKEFAHDIKAIAEIMLANNWYPPVDALHNRIVWENTTIIVTDANLEIVLATKNIYEMNGYRPDEVNGRNPRIFQGIETSADARKIIKSAITKQKSFHVSLLNYKKNGEPYWCEIKGEPIFNKQGKLVNYIALENAG